MTKYCPICRSSFEDSRTFCPVDGMRLFERADRFQGTLLAGRYRLHERIGSGGMALIYRAELEETGEPRAVKVLRPDVSRNAAQRVRFLREARSARMLEHENVVRIFELGETPEGDAFIVLEYLDGRTLGKYIDEGLLSTSEALCVAEQIGEAIAHAHSIGLLHRDIKAENIMIIEGGCCGLKAKILDFGLAQLRGDLRLTETGQVFGTPEYISPEQAAGEPATTASDQYALGIVLYEMLVGSPPFKGDPGKVLMSQFRESPAPPSNLRRPGAIPPALDALVMRMLAKDPAVRFPEVGLAVREMRRVRETL